MSSANVMPPYMQMQEWDLDEQDKVIKRAFRVWKETRPSRYLQSLSMIVPQVTPQVLPPDMRHPRVEIKETWDESIHPDYKKLLGAPAVLYDGPLLRPVYNDYREHLRDEEVRCPSGSVAVLSVDIGLSPEQFKNPPEGYMYVRAVGPNAEYPGGGWVYCIPKVFVKPVPQYALFLSRHTLSDTVESYKVYIDGYNEMVYLSIVQQSPYTTRYASKAPIAIAGSYDPNVVVAYAEEVLRGWEAHGIIPPRAQFTLSTRECLSVSHAKQMDA